MKKKTEELISEIKCTNNLDVYMLENKEEFNKEMFLNTLKAHYAHSGMSQEANAERSMLSHGFVNNILNNAKRPGRDTVIKLSFGLSLTVDKTNRLLKLAGHGQLYPRFERDAIMLFCLNKGVSLVDANILLSKRLEQVLAGKD